MHLQRFEGELRRKAAEFRRICCSSVGEISGARWWSETKVRSIVAWKFASQTRNFVLVKRTFVWLKLYFVFSKWYFFCVQRNFVIRKNRKRTWKVKLSPQCKSKRDHNLVLKKIAKIATISEISNQLNDYSSGSWGNQWISLLLRRKWIKRDNQFWKCSELAEFKWMNYPERVKDFLST